MKDKIYSNNNNLTDQEHWNEIWEPAKISRIDQQKIKERQIDLINHLKQLQFGNNRRILEVGVGPGLKLFEIAHYLHLEPWGLDFSETACNIARQNAAANDINAEVVRGDIFSAPFAPGRFAIVISQGVIEHFKNPFEILKKCSELVAAEGYLITTVPNIAGFCGFCMKKLDPERFYKHIAISHSYLRSMYKELGLQVILSDRLGKFHVPYISRRKGFLAWFFGGLLRKSLPALMRGINFESDYFSSELLIIGQK